MADKGRTGEAAAALYLESQGLKILERNFRAQPGEVDLVALDGETLVFVEVKTWSFLGVDALEQGLNERKQRRIIETAKYFLDSHREYRYMAIRFDVVFIAPQGITHLVSAFAERV
ncbi:MAG: YraN family protein [Treponema sp.]|jgi:putative endonuclease|nr:YraN family protein [Treponema sp.]